MVENSHPLARNVIDTSKITLPGALGDIESAFVITMQATHYCVCGGGWGGGVYLSCLTSAALFRLMSCLRLMSTACQHCPLNTGLYLVTPIPC